jgi:hypothetical protein
MSSNDIPFYNTFNSGFWLSLSALIFAFFGVALKSCYQSKCSQCSVCFGLLSIQRDTHTEEEIDLERRDIIPPASDKS